MTPKQLAEEAADKSWGIAESGKGMMQDAVEAALLAFAKAHAEEFRRLAANSEETQRCFKSPPMNRSAMQWERGVREGEAIAFRRAAQILEEKLNG